jgi:hypothetical protein
MDLVHNQITAPNCRQALQSRCVGFFGRRIRRQRPFPAAVGEFCRWRPMRTHRMKRFVLVGGTAVAAIGAVITFVPFGFDFGMMVSAVPTAVGRFLGVPNDASSWILAPLFLLTNGSMCFLLGAYLGFLAWLVTKPSTKANDSGA